MPNLIGQSLGRYHILEQLGEGGMATVYKALDTRLERDVAVKVLRTEQFAPVVLERIQKRFEREAKALARLSHPNIVKILDYGEQENKPYLVMEYLPGGTIKQKLGKPLAWLDSIHLLLPIGDALSYAHEHGILHRDVKPSNILLTEKGQPLLTDFGIAKILDLEEGQTLTATGVGIGTPEYMSPEQWLGKQVDASTDVYSLGIVLYELITGKKPFTADTPMAVVVKHINDPLPRPKNLVPDLPDHVEVILLKALSKNPKERYTNMSGFTQALIKCQVQFPDIDSTKSPNKDDETKSVSMPKPVSDNENDSQVTIDQSTTSDTDLQQVILDIRDEKKIVPNDGYLDHSSVKLSSNIYPSQNKTENNGFTGLGKPEKKLSFSNFWKWFHRKDLYFILGVILILYSLLLLLDNFGYLRLQAVYFFIMLPIAFGIFVVYKAIRKGGK